MIITITFIFFSIGLLFFGSLSFISFLSKRKKENGFRHLSNEGSKNNLVFCSQEILNNRLIGFDGIHRKILVLERNKKQYSSKIISLDEVEHCQLLTEEGIMEPNDFKQFGQQIRKGILELRFETRNHHETTSIVFNDNHWKPAREFALLKAKAEFWSIMFSKMLNQPLSMRA